MRRAAQTVVVRIAMFGFVLAYGIGFSRGCSYVCENTMCGKKNVLILFCGCVFAIVFLVAVASDCLT